MEAKITIERFSRDFLSRVVAYTKDHYTENVPELSFSYRKNRTYHYGGISNGKTFIKLAGFPFIAAAIQKKDKMVYEEYASFARCPVIGSVQGNWKKCLAAIIVHEVAHGIQYHAIHHEPPLLKSPRFEECREDVRPHGALWKCIYTDLRTRFVNKKEFRALPLTGIEVVQSKHAGGTEVEHFLDGASIAKYFAPRKGMVQQLTARGWINTPYKSAREIPKY